MPPPGARRSSTWSMKLRIRKMPRPLALSRFSGARIEALALVANANRQFGDGLGGGLEIDEHALGRVVAVAVLDGVDHRLANRHADPVPRVLVQADIPPHVLADHLDEIQHFEGARELEVNVVAGVERHAPNGAQRQNTTACAASSRVA